MVNKENEGRTETEKRVAGSGRGKRDASTVGTRSGTDPRVVVSRERVLTATLDLLTGQPLPEALVALLGALPAR